MIYYSIILKDFIDKNYSDMYLGINSYSRHKQRKNHIKYYYWGSLIQYINNTLFRKKISSRINRVYFKFNLLEGDSLEQQKLNSFVS